MPLPLVPPPPPALPKPVRCFWPRGGNKEGTLSPFTSCVLGSVHDKNGQVGWVKPSICKFKPGTAVQRLPLFALRTLMGSRGGFRAR